MPFGLRILGRMVWKPDVTVAAIIERDDRFLMIEEHVGGSVVINQPAGHLEANESLIDAVVREALEETAWSFQPDAVTGIYLWQHPERRISFLRVAFCGRALEHHRDRKLDHGIRRTLWLSREELKRQEHRLRSPMVMQCVDDYLAGRRYPLASLRHLENPPASTPKADVSDETASPSGP